MTDIHNSTSRDLSHVIGALEFGAVIDHADETLECAAQTLQPATSVTVCRSQVKMGPMCM